MKKIILSTLLIFLGSLSANAINPTYTAPNASNMDFYPMMRYQMEKQETLDFVNDPEGYHQKREVEESKHQKRSSNFNPNYTPNYGNGYLKPTRPVSMQFTKGDDGTIKIKGVPSNTETVNSTNK